MLFGFLLAIRFTGHSPISPTRSASDVAALYTSVCERGMEGVVAKPLGSAYRPGYRGWLKIKNPTYWRRGEELQLARRGGFVRTT